MAGRLVWVKRNKLVVKNYVKVILLSAINHVIWWANVCEMYIPNFAKKINLKKKNKMNHKIEQCWLNMFFFWNYIRNVQLWTAAFFIFNSFSNTLKRICLQFGMLFGMLFHSLLYCSLRSCENFCCFSCWWWWRCSLPYVHVWGVGITTGVSIGFSLGVIQTLIAKFFRSKPVLNSSAAWTELFTFL